MRFILKIISYFRVDFISPLSMIPTTLYLAVIFKIKKDLV
ncbi:hypothetical protein N41_1394 [Lactococcus cremoris]|nr:hypothetical protein N41_1394 [Lactococcus cremoris]